MEAATQGRSLVAVSSVAFLRSWPRHPGQDRARRLRSDTFSLVTASVFSDAAKPVPIPARPMLFVNLFIYA